MKLDSFIKVVEDLEEHQFEEGVFWKSRSNLGGNFLSTSLDRNKIQIHFKAFLAKWASYRHPIDWDKLTASWGTQQQRAAQSLSVCCLEDAIDSELFAASDLFQHLWESSISGLGTTNISKLLAMGLPSVCVMWDQGIKKEFIENNPSRPFTGHVPQMTTYYLFLMHRRSELNQIIEEASTKNSTDRITTISWLEQLPQRVHKWERNKPLAKLIDEYYYWKPRLKAKASKTLDDWFEISPDTYNSFWYEGISTEELYFRLKKQHPQIFQSIICKTGG